MLWKINVTTCNNCLVATLRGKTPFVTVLVEPTILIFNSVKSILGNADGVSQREQVFLMMLHISNNYGPYLTGMSHW